ncbi:MAG: xanthine dehydrogenase molybdopterin binding subunit, partial [Asticcacaulis sp.]|nr:xanthine dehydrogenase molybdopterin binding subunit [Asticcacaulis sp.]
MRRLADQEPFRRAVRASLPHDSAEGHVAGSARYADDMPEPNGMLHLAFGKSSEAHAAIVAIDLSAVRAAPGVVAVFTADDIPGDNNVAPVFADDPLLANGEVLYVGQPIFLVAATSAKAARMAARLGKIDYTPRPAILTIAEALDAGAYIEQTQHMARGDAAASL